MAETRGAKPTIVKVREHRERLRAQGACALSRYGRPTCTHHLFAQRRIGNRGLWWRISMPQRGRRSSTRRPTGIPVHFNGE